MSNNLFPEGSAAERKARMADFLDSLEPPRDPFLEELREEAARDDVPILRKETESFLKTLLAFQRPQRILEIGTAIGYSAILMAKAADCRIDTIENYPPRIEAAKQNIARAGLEGQIRLLEGDAGAWLSELPEGLPYDFIFLDAAKGQYLIWLEDILRHMGPGSILLADNVLQEETVLESRFAVPRRERTTHARMREFLYRIKHDPRLTSSVLPLGDGVSLSVRNPDKSNQT